MDKPDLKLAKVIPFVNGETYCDVPVKNVLNGAIEIDLNHVLVIGRLENGDYYYASSTSDVGCMLLYIERFKQQILQE